MSNTESLLFIYKEIDPTVQFGLERENALIKKYDGRLQPNGDIQFVHGDSDEARETGIANMQKFKDEMDDLGEMEIEAEITPVKLGYDSFGNQKISPAEIMDLEGFIVFE